jgi:hypothetical protein
VNAIKTVITGAERVRGSSGLFNATSGHPGRVERIRPRDAARWSLIKTVIQNDIDAIKKVLTG